MKCNIGLNQLINHLLIRYRIQHNYDMFYYSYETNFIPPRWRKPNINERSRIYVYVISRLSVLYFLNSSCTMLMFRYCVFKLWLRLSKNRFSSAAVCSHVLIKLSIQRNLSESVASHNVCIKIPRIITKYKAQTTQLTIAYLMPVTSNYYVAFWSTTITWYFKM